METKTQQMIKHLQAGQQKECLRIAKTFRIGFTKDEIKTVQLGYECLVHPQFYVSLGKDPQAAITAAINCLTEKYKEKELEPTN